MDPVEVASNSFDAMVRSRLSKLGLYDVSIAGLRMTDDASHYKACRWRRVRCELVYLQRGQRARDSRNILRKELKAERAKECERAVY